MIENHKNNNDSNTRWWILALLAMMGRQAELDMCLLVAIIIISGVISHAPAQLRYYSFYHGRVVESTRDCKG